MNGFGIKNFRSFDSEGVFLDNLKKINIIIGKNNCGKSNVLRLLQLLHKHINDLSKFPNDLTNQHKRNGRNAILSVNVKGTDLLQNIDLSGRFQDYHLNDFLERDHIIDFNITSRNIELPDYITKLDSHELLKFQGHYSQAGKESLLEIIKNNWKQVIENRITKKFGDLIYIPHLRVIKEGHDIGDSNSSINGSNIISKMFEMQNPKIGDEKLKEKFYLIQNFVRDLINKPDLIIEIPHNKEEIVLTIDENRLPLDYFGTGIHQLVMLCSALVIHENAIVCIEEPEIHLHPELQRKFIDFLGSTKNIYFITTHSNVFLNSKQDISIYHVQNDGFKSDVINIDSSNRAFDILDDLGYQSSDILQSNGVIWVEGPSDRTYILKWINLLDNTLVEGLHFSIMFYGGRLLSHLSFENDKIINELIPLLKINRNAFVVMDRDGFTSKAKINHTKTRIKEEIGDNNCWISKGREIENYLSPKTISNWLKIERINLHPDTKLENLIPKTSNKKYEIAKSKYSAEIIQSIGIEDLDILDLRAKVNQLIKEIKRWNN